MEQLSEIGFYAAHKKYLDAEMFRELCAYQDKGLAPDEIPHLKSEVERLTAKLQTLTGVEAQEHQQIATLKKQINLMAKYIVEQGNVDMNLCDDIPNELHLKYQPKNDGDYENEPCIQCVQEYFRQQAEQYTDEVTHGEAEKK